MKISAVITTFNRRDLVPKALASAQAQTRPPDEILIIDDGSTDGTAEILFHKKIRYHWQENAGTSAARNAGWQLATSEWIAFLDSDDLWEKEKLAQQESAVLAEASLEAVFGHAVNFTEAAEQTLFHSEKHRLNTAIPAWLPSAALVRRSHFEKVGGFDPALKTAEVVDWIMRLRQAGSRVLMRPEIVLRRRLHGGNKQLASADSQRENFALLRRWQEFRRRAL